MITKTRHQIPPSNQKDKKMERFRLIIYNTLTRRKEAFKPLEPDKIRMYTCGLTVNNLMHIGHARTYIFWDVVERFLRYLGFKVMHVSNVTDISVDDKILKRVRSSGISFQQLVTQHTWDYYQDRHLLGITDPVTFAIATQHIQEMIALIQQLIELEFAYEAEDGIYFRVSAFPTYGQLAGIDPDKLRAGAGGRVNKDEYDKETVGDFALWKRAKPDEPFWHSPWGPGRPGWHIECSAMAKKYLGITVDISGGGEDNIFPHHENSRAQSEAAHSKPFVRYWMHVRHLQVAGEKMSKSIGNILTVRDAVNQVGAASLRLSFLATHYRKPLTFKMREMSSIQSQLNRLRHILARLSVLSNFQQETVTEDKQIIAALDEARHNFDAALLDDFNTGRAINTLFQFVNFMQSILESNRIINGDLARRALSFFSDIGIILFGDLYLREVYPQLDPILSKVIQLLLNERERLRIEKQFEQADALRIALNNMGFEIVDTKTGTLWWPKL